MVNENEVIMLILGIGVLTFTFIHKAKIKRIYAWRNLMAGFYLLLFAWIFTIAEGFYWGYFLNIFEHACYGVSAVIIAIWCLRLLFSHKKIVT
ncbi:MAG: hypothetical protein JXK95_16465 [Bacteroidales bacterium]|nr:hypothetical protein [Bacteroidales bacterium]